MCSTKVSPSRRGVTVNLPLRVGPKSFIAAPGLLVGSAAAQRTHGTAAVQITFLLCRAGKDVQWTGHGSGDRFCITVINGYIARGLANVNNSSENSEETLKLQLRGG
jgi:hypothetical protein